MIRGLLEAYYLMSISAVYQASNTDFASDDGWINFILSVLTLVYLVAFPILSLRYLLKNKAQLEKPRMIQKYGALYQNVNPTSSVALRFTTYFCARRLVFAILICLLSSSLVL